MSKRRDNDISKLTVGVLALQGDFERHILSIESVGATGCEVRSVEDFHALDALILPGGESTTMALLLHEFEMWSTLQSFVSAKPVWGTCAGLILLSSAIVDADGAPDTTFAPIGALDVTVARNAYGRQIHSFEEKIEVVDGAQRFVAPVSFIRAPKIARVGPKVEVLATANNLPTLVRQRDLLGSAFHTELHGDTTFIRYFLGTVTKTIMSNSNSEDKDKNVTAIEPRSREVA